MTRYSGTGVGTGTGTGPVVWLDRPGTSTGTAARDHDSESARERFDHARDVALAELEAEQAEAAAAIGGDAADVLATHESFLTDPAFEERVVAAIEAGDPANRAIGTAIEAWIEVFESQGGRTAARADDLRDLRGRLLRALTTTESDASIEAIPQGAVVCTARLLPSEAARLTGERVAGIATVEGTPSGHAAVLARAVGVPLIVGVGDALTALDDGATVTVDADAGQIFEGHPSDTGPQQTGSAPERLADGLVGTAGGREVTIAANVGSGREAEMAAERGLAGVALFRTEALAYRASGIPPAEEQFTTYRAALDAFPGDRVCIRTFDFGGDKPLPGESTAGTSGAPTARGIARALDARDELTDQFHALCRAHATSDGSLHVLLPHVTSVDQVEAARDRLRTAADVVGVDPPALGVMLETPASVHLAPELADAAASIAIGTNDLLAGLYGQARDDTGARPPVSPAFLRALLRAADAAAAADVPLSCCGDLASDPAWARRLVAIGVDTLGVPPGDAPAVARAIDGFDEAAVAETVQRAASASTNSEVARLLTRSEGA